MSKKEIEDELAAIEKDANEMKERHLREQNAIRERIRVLKVEMTKVALSEFVIDSRQLTIKS